jgi:hypothetical protein
MDLSKLSTGDKVIGVSGILLLVFSFFPWLGVKVESGVFSGSDSKGAWSFTLCLLAVLLGIALVVLVALKASNVELPALGSITWNQVALIVAGVVVLFILIKLITGPGGVPDVPGVSKERKIGIYLGFLASLGLLAGAFLNVKEADELKFPSSGGTPPSA